MGAHFEALDEGVLLVPLDSRYTQVGFNPTSVQVCSGSDRGFAAEEFEQKKVKRGHEICRHFSVHFFFGFQP